MPRIPYLSSDLHEPAELVSAIRARRGGRLLHLDRMLLHSPAFARGWNAFLGAVRSELDLPARLRELAICAVAVLNGADYEFAHHAPEFLKAGGTQAQLAGVRRMAQEDPAPPLFNGVEVAVLRLTAEMTRQITVSDATFAEVRAALADEQQVVELVGIVAAYNMVSRFLVALHVSPEDSAGATR
ncbi:carboxymuconolactone decarboxylase family protein [Geoalkalibacter halelectricus]|uniref:Carboxymuconolactone decarboxylase family protein n=1 Tax=Geoalkalibacter halelectricus TaxID=2847045 RepID=A0ABY5ZMH7_9BACT|nr:carboxymuconolactone decarboxylase family protein [Geoalkalibacter halelectricus]MDO3380114.1 carboxymuconolactone decarboxylase family protein [Geoalkalibacter halelectricus]UWZ80367.1 carboxymuconolactone decarboxylase family protein [Geoalkalibacter halelectricus]